MACSCSAAVLGSAPCPKWVNRITSNRMATAPITVLAQFLHTGSFAATSPRFP